MSKRGLRNVLIAWLLLTGTASAAENLWGLTTDHTLVRFSSSAPGTLLASFPITGLPEGERIVAIEVSDWRGVFVGVSTAGRVYTLDRLTGAATRLNPVARSTPLTGTAFAMYDRVLVSNDGSGVNVDDETGWTSPGPTLTPPVHAVALSRAVDDFPVLLDSHTDALYRASFGPSPQILIGPLNVDISDEAGLDVGPHDRQLYAALTVNGAHGLYTIDSTTGNATLVGAIPSAPITSLAVDLQGVPRPTASTDTVVEADTTVAITVRRTGDTTVAAQYLAETKPGGSWAAATPGEDYVVRSELLPSTPAAFPNCGTGLRHGSAVHQHRPGRARHVLRARSVLEGRPWFGWRKGALVRVVPGGRRDRTVLRDVRARGESIQRAGRCHDDVSPGERGARDANESRSSARCTRVPAE